MLPPLLFHTPMPIKKLPILPEVEALFAPQQMLLRRCSSLLFALAGFSWFLLLLPDSVADAAHHAHFRNGQYQLYTVLLTLWGYDYRRHSLRLTAILELSAVLGKSPRLLTAGDIQQAGKLHVFEILSKHDGSKPKYFHIAFMWLLLTAAAALFVRQGFVLFG